MVVVEETASASAPAPQLRSSRRVRRGPVVAVLAVALVVAGVVWWVFNPHTLANGGYEVLAPGHVGRANYFDAGVYSGNKTSRSIDVRSVRPVLVTNSAAASVGVLLCHNVPGGDHLGATYDLTSVCTSVTAFRAGPIPLSGDGVQIILVVTPNTRGTVRIEGVDVSYHDGIRRGHQRTGMEIIVHAT